MTLNKTLLIAGAISILALTALVGKLWVHETTGNSSHTLTLQRLLHNVVTPRETDFSLIDHNGRAVSEQTYRGRFMLVYFGYTQCTDICPYDLAAATQALDLLGPGESKVQPIFITIDPEHDTPEALAGYVSLYHPRLVGLTGDKNQVTAAAKTYGASYEKELVTSFTGHGHSANMYLVGRNGEFLRAIRTPTTAEAVAEVIRLYINEESRDERR